VIVNRECIEDDHFLSNEKVAAVGPKLTCQDGRTQLSRRRYPCAAIMTHRYFLKEYLEKILSEFLMGDINDEI
jgi:hypothetical protein